MSDDHKLELDYPCRWDYTVIGRDEPKMRDAIAEIVGDSEHTLRPSNTSRTGKYTSLALQVVVADDQMRIEIFHALRGHDDVMMVL